MIYILNYKGKSIVSKLIKLATWGDFSHTAICNEKGETVEAWHIGGVLKTKTPWDVHKKDTEIVVYGLKIDPIAAKRIWQEAENLVGFKYDFRALLGFVPGLRWLWANDRLKWFCSHAVATVCRRAGAPLFSPQTKLHKISPALIDTTPELKRLGIARNMAELKEIVN